ncbi:hypothetical protein BJI67_01610 [Acidihalobacter aeolianus]|uniref:Uncharacterized protein n=1 Tax=Acidihalobacter aeolianus TaxID=2792603 RepID=A0A1D8K4R5_9GAMM|nr:hypothetical protein [Acidihalobacter aeolianus]AOV15942.1 hypothetical protein BJI67_01610 [Acidihalobacter aeolianus]
MADTMIWVFVVGLGLLLLGLLALLRVAFRETLLWGLLVILLPPLLLWYVVTRWRQTQVPVYVVLSAMLIVIAALYGGASTPLADYLRHSSLAPVLMAYGWNGRIDMPFKPEDDVPVSNAGAVEALREQEAAAARAQKLAEQKVRPKPSKPTPPPVYRYQLAGLNHLEQYAGRRVRVETVSGGTVEGVLASVTGDGITVNADQSIGSVGYQLNWSRITAVSVYAPKGSVIPPAKPASSTSGEPSAGTAASAPLPVSSTSATPPAAPQVQGNLPASTTTATP